MRYLILAFLFSFSVHADILPVPSPVPSMTSAEIKAQLIIDQVSNITNGAPGRYQIMQNILWHSKDKPCDIIAGMGSQAKKVIAAGQGAPSYLNSIVAGTIVPIPHPSYTITPQSDGTATCSGP